MNVIERNAKIAARSVEYQNKVLDLFEWMAADGEETLETYAMALEIDPTQAVDEADLIDQILSKEDEIFFK